MSIIIYKSFFVVCILFFVPSLSARIMSVEQKSIYDGIIDYTEISGNSAATVKPLNDHTHPIRNFSKALGSELTVLQGGNKLLSWKDSPLWVKPDARMVTLICNGQTKIWKWDQFSNKKDIENGIKGHLVNICDVKIRLDPITQIKQDISDVSLWASNDAKSIFTENMLATNSFVMKLKDGSLKDRVNNFTFQKIGSVQNGFDSSLASMASIRMMGGYIEAGSRDAYNFGSGDFSIQLKMRTKEQGLGVILDKRREDSIEVRGFHVFVSQGKLGLQLADGTHKNFHTNISVADDKWHDVLISVDRNSETGLKFVIDGMVAGVFDPRSKSGSLSNNKPLRFGRWSDNNSPFKNRRTRVAVTNVGFFDKALPTERYSCVDQQFKTSSIRSTNLGRGNHFSACGRSGESEENILRYVADTPGTYRFSTAGSDYDTVLLATNSCDKDVKLIKCDDDGGPERSSELDVYLERGQAVLIGVSGYRGASGEFQLSVQKP